MKDITAQQVGKGILRTVYCDSRTVADMVPVDLPINTMIVAAWYTAVHKPTPNARIYQITTGSTNPIQWAAMGKLWHS